jgi:type VI secretion system secreted protein VgrG
MPRPTVVTAPKGLKLLFHRMEAREQLGRPFEFVLDLLSEDDEIKFDAILGERVTVTLEIGEGGERYFNGYVCAFSQLPQPRLKYTVYRAVVRPWLWFLTRMADCRIFQEKTVPDIVKQVFKDHGFDDVKDKLKETYHPREYCVQYRETDFNFVSRLMEEEGVYYYFTHEDGKHTLVLADGRESHAKVSGFESISYRPPSNLKAKDPDTMFAWSLSRTVQSGTIALEDYDFTRPKADLLVKRSAPKGHAHAKGEVFDYPGGYQVSGDGEHYARVRMDELSGAHERVHVDGHVRGLWVGDLFKLMDAPRSDQDREYLIVEGKFVLQSSEYLTGGEPEPEPYACSFEIGDAKEPFRLARTTPRARVHGPQTALVVGKQGEEIWTDKYGRVKVQFPWERYTRSDEKSSCWVRVAQAWAGKSFGGFQIPRIGEEVIVDFLEGNPDRPIVTGRVYNGDNMFPYALPAEQTKSGLKSRSSKQGSTENFNELRFEDKKGEEEIYFHAEKNFVRVVENDDKLEVGLVKKDPGSQAITVHKDRTATIKTGNETLLVEQGNRSVTIKMGNHQLEVSMGNQTTAIKMGKSETTAMQSIELKVGGNSIKIDQSGVTIKGIMIKVEGSAMVDVKGPMTNVKGDGMVVVKGGLVTIN